MSIWHILFTCEAKLLNGLFALMGVNAEMVLTHPNADYALIRSAEFSVWIEKACSGLIGMGIMEAFLLLTMLFDRREFAGYNRLAILLVGAIYAWLVNIVRLAAYFMIGYLHGSAAALEMFHTWAGAVLYVAAFSLFIMAFHRHCTAWIKCMVWGTALWLGVFAPSGHVTQAVADTTAHAPEMPLILIPAVLAGILMVNRKRIVADYQR